MKLNEVTDQAKLQQQLNKLQAQVKEQDQHIVDLLIDVGQLKRTLEALIKKLGPRS